VVADRLKAFHVDRRILGVQDLDLLLDAVEGGEWIDAEAEEM
jgi:hypothetical protein